MIELLDLPFKNSRSYIHGSSLFEAVLGDVETADLLRVKFLQPLRHQPLLTDESPKNIESIVAEFRWTVEDQTVTRWVVDSGYPVLQREKIDERSHINGATLLAGSVWQEAKQNLSFINRLIGLNKLLLENEFGFRDFWFVKLDLTNYVRDRDFLRIITGKNIGESVFDTVLLNRDDEKIGQIRFVRRS